MTWLPKRGGQGCSPGLTHRLTMAHTVGDPNASDRFGWPVDGLSTAAFDWADGDGTTPNKGPTLSTTGGSPSAGLITPWLGVDRDVVTATDFALADYYTTSTAVDPSAGDDMVVLMLMRLYTAGSLKILMGTRTDGAGWWVYYSGGNLYFYGNDGDSLVQSFQACSAGAWVLMGVTYDASGNQVLYINGVAQDTDDVSGQDELASTVGLGLAATPAGASSPECDIARAMVWYGSNLAATATAAWHKTLAWRVLGIKT